MSDKPKKRRFWQVDPSIYNKTKRAGFLERRVAPILRQVGKLGLIVLAIGYPIYLVYIGLAFGGAFFWLFLVGSTAVIGAVITKLGYASNFRAWDIGVKRMIGVVLGFFVAAGFYAAIIYLKTWVVPVSFLILGIGLFLLLRRVRL